MSVEKNRLKITEIFYSLQGESRTVGIPTVFVRLTGCPLRCLYCDTSYAFNGGHWMSLDEIMVEIDSHQAEYITVTGGEPLAQTSSIELLKRVCDAGYKVSIETSGALSIEEIDQRVTIVMDLKTPDSGEETKNRMENIDRLKSTDEVKFVICSESDYEWSKSILTQYQLDQKCSVLFSPSHDQQDVTQLADWILRDKMPVRLQVQLHKYLWGNVAGK